MRVFEHHINSSYLINSNKRATAVLVEKKQGVGCEANMILFFYETYLCQDKSSTSRFPIETSRCGTFSLYRNLNAITLGYLLYFLDKPAWLMQ
jgi:hypothetical protein